MIPELGFDFDECLAQGYSMLPIILFLEGFLVKEYNSTAVSSDVKTALKNAKTVFYDRIASNEVASKGTILRPSFLKVLPDLLKKRKDGKVDSLFIYSNNENRLLINIIDHILALTLLKLNVSKEYLLENEKDGLLHTMTPRITKLDACRSNEPTVNKFKEKTFEGVQTCLGKSLSENSLWFFDDTRDHKALISKIKANYIETKKYEVKLRNSKLAELLVISFPKDAFNPNTPIGKVFLKAYSNLEAQFIVVPAGELYLTKDNPRLNLKGAEDQKKIVELLTLSLKEISPLSSGNLKRNWSAADISADVSKILKAIEPAFIETVYQTPDKSLSISTATAYSEPIGGGKHLSRSRSKKYKMRRNRHFLKKTAKRRFV